MDKQARTKQLLQLWGDLKNTRSPYEAGWKEITRFCSPDKDFWTDVKENATGKPNQIYDGTPLSALSLLANGLQGYMASKATKSFKVALDSHRTLRYKPYDGRMRQYMQDLEDVFYWMIDRSNFYDAANEAFMVGGSIATMSMYVDLVPGEDRIVNTVMHPHRVWIAENDARKIDTEFRTIPMTAKDCVRRWRDSLSEAFVKQAEISPYRLHEILHVVLPRDTRDATKIDNLNKPSGSYWILPGEELMLQESGFDSFPYINWRWSTPHGGTYGWGPAHNAMADIIRSNQVNKSVLESAHQFLYPALNVPQEQMGRLDLRPKGMNPYVDPSRRIYPIQNTGSFPIARDREEALEKAVRDHFFVDMFLMLNQSAAGGKRTATEVMEMQAEKAAIMGAITTRIETEFFNPLFDRYFEIAGDNGWLPEPPPELYDILAASEVKIDYIGPMSQVQQRFYNQQAVDEPLKRIIMFGEFFPEMLDVIDADKLGRHLVNESPLPNDLIRSKDEVAAIQKGRAEAQKAQMQAENAQKNSQAMKNMGDTNAAGLQQLAQGLAGAAPRGAV